MAPPGETVWDVALRPMAIVAAGVTAGVLLGAGVSLPVVVLVAGAAWGLWARAAARRRTPSAARPAAVRTASGAALAGTDGAGGADRWSREAGEAAAAARRYGDAVRSCARGPLRDRLVALGRDVDEAAARASRLAGYGRDLERAIDELDVGEVRRRLKRLPKSRGGSLAREALEEQLATAGRLQDELDDVRGRLMAVVARLDDAAARAVHVTVRAGEHRDHRGEAPGTAALVAELEPLRHALAAIRDPRDEPRDAPSSG